MVAKGDGLLLGGQKGISVIPDDEVLYLRENFISFLGCFVKI